MKKQVKIISAILIAVMLVLSMTTIVSASTVKDALSTSNLGGTSTNDKVVSFGKTLVPIVRAVGIIAAVVILMIVGIKYMMGSAEEKAEYKKTMPAYVIGAILVLASTQIIGFILDISSSISA